MGEKFLGTDEILKKEYENKVNFIYDIRLDLLRYRCQNNSKKNGLNCPMFTARYLKQKYNFCKDCDHMNVSE